MIITVINGQNHKGSTYNIGKILVGNLGGNEVHEFFLPRDLNHFCTGCCSCIKDESLCPFFEEKKRIMDAVEKSDLLIFTTPTYCMRTSAPMKAFIDLTFTYWMSHKPRASMFSKKAVVICRRRWRGISHKRYHKYTSLLGRPIRKKLWQSYTSHGLGAYKARA